MNYINYVNEVAFSKIFCDKDLSTEDKLLFVYLAMKKSKIKNNIISINVKEVSENLNIPKNIIKKSIKNLSKYIYEKPILKLIK